MCMYSIVSVSYTHLDVYKRQLQFSVSEYATYHASKIVASNYDHQLKKRPFLIHHFIFELKVI